MGNYKIVATGLAPDSVPAPNIASVTASAYYGMQWNGSAFGLEGVITLPATGVSYIKEIDIDALLENGSTVPVQTLYGAFSGSTVGFKGPLDIPQLINGAVQDAILKFTCKNGSNAATPAAKTFTVHVQASKVDTLSASENLAVRGILPENQDTRLESMEVDIVPVLNANQLPQNVTIWISSDEGNHWIGINWYLFTDVGQMVPIRRIVPGVDQQWMAAACAGAHEYTSEPIETSALPAGSAFSPVFPVKGLELSSPTAATNISILNVKGQNFQAVNRFRADNSQYGEIGAVQATDPLDSSFFLRITTEELDENHISLPDGGGERAHSGWQVSGGVHHDDGLLVTYRTGLAFIRHKVYLANRNSQGNSVLGQEEFKDPTTHRLQTGWVGGPTDYCDIAVTALTDAAPEVVAYRAGTYRQGDKSWGMTMRWDILKTKLLVDYAFSMPARRDGLRSVALHIKTAAGVVQATDQITPEDCIQSADGLSYFGSVAIEGPEIPATPQLWDFIACTYGIDGAPNVDSNGEITGPSISLSTIPGEVPPINELGQVNLDTATGSVSIANIRDISSINIQDLTGQLSFTDIANIGAININDFTGNLPISRVTSIGSIDINTFSGNLSMNKITDLGSVSITSFSGSLPISRVTDLGSIDIGSFSGSLALNKITNLASFGIQNFEGVLVTQQLADGILNDLKKFSSDLRPITKVAALPAPTDANYPVGTVVLLTTTSVLYKNNGTAFVAVTAADTVTGKISDSDILSINCSKFVGQILAANVQNIRVDNLVGTLSVAQTNSLSITNMTGNIDMSRVNNLNSLSLTNLTGNIDMSRVNNLTNLSITNLQGNLDASRVSNIGNISITSLKGNLDVSRVANISTISIGTLNGNLDGSRISNLGALNIGSMTGNLTATQLGNLTINNLNATTVNLTGQWKDGQIVAVSCSKLIAGSINVSGEGITFDGAAGVTLMNNGNLYVNPGRIYATRASFMNVAVGWDVVPGPFPYIKSTSTDSYLDCGGYRVNAATGKTVMFTFKDVWAVEHQLTFNGGILTNYT